MDRAARRALVAPARDDDPRRRAVGVERAADLSVAEPVAVQPEAAAGGPAGCTARHAGPGLALLHRRR